LEVVNTEEERDYLESLHRIIKIQKTQKVVSKLQEKWNEIKPQIPTIDVVKKEYYYNPKMHEEEYMDIKSKDPFSTSSNQHKPPTSASDTYQSPIISTLSDASPISDFNCKSPSDIMKALHACEGWEKTQKALSKNQLTFNELAARITRWFAGNLAHWWAQLQQTEREEMINHQRCQPFGRSHSCCG